MLDDLKNKIDALRSFNWGEEMEAVIKQNEEALADFQAEQLAKGINRLGQEILPEYRPFTIEQKRKKSGLAAVTDHVTYYDTGELYKSLQGEVGNKQYDITSPSFKFDKMKKRSGERVVGLTEESRLRFAEEITIPGVRKRFKEKTGFTF